MTGIKNFKDLEIWQKGINLVKEIYRITEDFPNKEIYALTSQIRRASISIPSNIAEGFKRLGPKEFRHFLNIALGSLAELETQLIIASELNYISTQIKDNILEKTDHLTRMTFSLIKHL